MLGLLGLDPDETRSFRSFIVVYLLVIIKTLALSIVAIFTVGVHRIIRRMLTIAVRSGVKNYLLIRDVHLTGAFFRVVGALLRYAGLAFGFGGLAELATGDLCNADLLHEIFLWVTIEWGHIGRRLGCFSLLTFAP